MENPNNTSGQRRSFTSSDSAEEALFASIEERRGRVRTASGEVYRTAVAGERPPLYGNVGLTQMASLYGEPLNKTVEGTSQDESAEKSKSNQPSDARRRFRDIATKVIEQRKGSPPKGKGSPPKDGGGGGSTRRLKMAGARPRHKRSHTLNAQAILESISLDTDTAASTKASNFFQNVGGEEAELGKSEFAVEDTQVDRLVRDAMQVESLLEGDEQDAATTSTAEEELPLVGAPIPDQITTTATATAKYGSGQQSFAEKVREKRTNRRRRKWYLKAASKLASCFDPIKLYLVLRRMILNMQLTAVAMVLFVVAGIFFYGLRDPHFDFMPGPATLSWWCNFLGRQLLTLQLAQATQYLFIEGLVLGSKYTVQLLGPLVSLWALQAKGYPLLLLAWGTWDLLLLHGANAFQTHWLYWTNFAIYSSADSGSYILTSPIYLRFLLSLILAGLLTSIKRAVVAVYFGRRTFSEFKPRLESLLKDIVLLCEVADLAEEAERIAGEDKSKVEDPLLRQKTKARVDWMDDEHKWSSEELPLTSSQDEQESFDARLSRGVSGSLRIKGFLDRWQEPINKLDSTTEASVSDILRFRRALAFMDEDRPFGDSFGDARTRDECIESAHQVYLHLKKLTPETPLLSHDVLVMLCQDDDGMINVAKHSALRRLFRPDRKGLIPMLDFVQSIDKLYRNLRYFRASVGNASVIDHALERMVNGAFMFLLFLLILTVMNINPWPLLVSLSTVLVSLSFAMGSSASKYIEGVILIALRRPYDLGDRVVMSSADLVDNPGSGSSWLVEDINLYTTTLRFAPTNEVATVSNGTIANSRIVNLNRSHNAVCAINLPMHVCITKDDKVDIYRTAIEKYVQDNPTIWESLVDFRFNSFDSDNEGCILRIALRHRNSWQDAPRVLRDWGEFQKFLFNIGDTMGIDFDTPPARRVLYRAGSLVTGHVQDYKRNLIRPNNIQAASSTDEAEDETGKPTISSRPPSKDVSDTLFLAHLQHSNK